MYNLIFYKSSINPGTNLTLLLLFHHHYFFILTVYKVWQLYSLTLCRTLCEEKQRAMHRIPGECLLPEFPKFRCCSFLVCSVQQTSFCLAWSWNLLHIVLILHFVTFNMSHAFSHQLKDKHMKGKETKLIRQDERIL